MVADSLLVDCFFCVRLYCFFIVFVFVTSVLTTFQVTRIRLIRFYLNIVLNSYCVWIVKVIFAVTGGGD